MRSNHMSSLFTHEELEEFADDSDWQDDGVESDKYTEEMFFADVYDLPYGDEDVIPFDEEIHGGHIDTPVYVESDGSITPFCFKDVADMPTIRKNVGITAHILAERLVPIVQERLGLAVTGDDVASVENDVQKFDTTYPFLKKPLSARVATPLRRHKTRVARGYIHIPKGIAFPVIMNRGKKAQALAADPRSYKHFARQGYVPTI
jgi:hypothetical protein